MYGSGFRLDSPAHLTHSSPWSMWVKSFQKLEAVCFWVGKIGELGFLSEDPLATGSFSIGHTLYKATPRMRSSPPMGKWNGGGLSV